MRFFLPEPADAGLDEAKLKFRVGAGARLAGVVPHLGFAEALAALRAGDAERLRALLRADPSLVKARSELEPPMRYFAGATLLHMSPGIRIIPLCPQTSWRSRACSLKPAPPRPRTKNSAPDLLNLPDPDHPANSLAKAGVRLGVCPKVRSLFSPPEGSRQTD